MGLVPTMLSILSLAETLFRMAPLLGPGMWGDSHTLVTVYYHPPSFSGVWASEAQPLLSAELWSAMLHLSLDRLGN